MTGEIATRIRTLLIGLLAAATLVAADRSAQAEGRVSVSFFYDELAPDGYWVEDVRYGTVWYPRRRPADWQPYVYGRWVWTADYGWYWDSDEDWGWATYHYGRWVYTDAYGWVWVPDDEWGPAWVEWRTGGGYVGWTPMPPEMAWRGGTFVYVGIDLSGPRYRPHWVFVAEPDFVKPDPWRYRAPRMRAGALLRASVRATNYRLVETRIVNRSIDPARISAAAKVRIGPAAVVTTETRLRGRAQARGHVSIYRPRLAARTKVRTDVRSGTGTVGSRIDTETDLDLPPVERPSIGRPAVDGDFGVRVGPGVGIGGGGGLRIGR
jgi:hypothetical protein